MLRRLPMVFFILLVLATLPGCASEAPVSLGATTPAATGAPPPAPTATPAAQEASAPPEAGTPAPAASLQPPQAFRWPADAASLFSPGGVPDDYGNPLYIASDRRMFLYATEDGNLRKALWSGAGYGTVPVGENVDATRANAVVVDEAGGRVFCPGTRQYAAGKTGPSVVMIRLSDGSRCNLDEAARFSEESCTVSSDFQYAGGKLLVRLADDTGKPLDKYAVFDVAKRTYAVLDFSGFREKHLQGWREQVSLTVALTGADRLLAVCAVGGYTAPASTGAGETPEKQPYECFAVPLDLAGAPAGSAALVAGGQAAACCSLQSGAGFRASPGGGKLLYTVPGGGLYIYDIAANRETEVYPGGATLPFAGWGSDGAVYYAAATAQPAGGYLIYKTNSLDTAYNQ